MNFSDLFFLISVRLAARLTIYKCGLPIGRLPAFVRSQTLSGLAMSNPSAMPQDLMTSSWLHLHGLLDRDGLLRQPCDGP